MAVTVQQGWPDRALNILIPTITLCILSTAVLVWRLVYGIKAKRRLMLWDYLLIIAAVCHPQQLLQEDTSTLIFLELGTEYRNFGYLF
jgi:hypothetical protein